MDHRQVHHALYPGLAGDVEGDERLGEFVGDHGVEQEQRGDARESLAERIHIQHVALHQLHGCGQVGGRGGADQCADVCAALGEVLDDLTADGASGAGNKNGHGVLGWVVRAP
ncbi:hypothetical protein D3C72_2087040 [compost metagenome]